MEDATAAPGEGIATRKPGGVDTQGVRVGRLVPPFRRSGNRSAGRYDASGPSNGSGGGSCSGRGYRQLGRERCAACCLARSCACARGAVLAWHSDVRSQIVAMGNDLRRLTTSDIPLLGRQHLEPALHRLMLGPRQRAGAFEPAPRHPWNEHAKPKSFASSTQNQLASGNPIS